MTPHSTARQLEYYAERLAFETDSWDLNAAVDAGENVTIIDTRPPAAYGREHIPGAINIPHRAMSDESTDAIDADSLVVTYCDGIGCNASTKGALRMATLGFEVRELLGGIVWWKDDGYPTHGIEEERADGQCGC